MLVLAMEFSRDARHLDSKVHWRLADRIRERPTVGNTTIGIATEVTDATPSKRNSEVRRSSAPGIRGRPGISPKGDGRPAAAGKRKKAE